MNIELTPESRAQIGELSQLLATLEPKAALSHFDRMLKLIDRASRSGAAVVSIAGLDELLADVRAVNSVCI